MLGGERGAAGCVAPEEEEGEREGGVERCGLEQPRYRVGGYACRCSFASACPVRFYSLSPRLLVGVPSRASFHSLRMGMAAG